MNITPITNTTPIAPQKLEIAARLVRMAAEMESIGVAMDYYGGLAEWARHGKELAGAANICREWAFELGIAE